MPFVPDQPRKSRFVPDAQPAAPDEFAGDDLLSNESMANLSAGVHPTPTAEPSALKGVNAYGSGINDAAGEFNRAKPAGLAGQLDALTTMATGGIAAPVLGTIESAVVGTDPAKAHERYTWQPRTESGKALLKLLGAGMAPITESGADIALGPIAAADSQVMRAAGRTAPKELPLIPSTKELGAAAKQAYAVGKESGVLVSPESYSKALGNVRKMVTEEGIDPTLHSKSSAVMKRLEDADGKPLGLQEAETLRKIAMDAEDDLNPVTREPTPDARMAGKIVDELDDSVDALLVNSPARELYRRSKLSQMLDKMEHRAEINAGAHYTQAGMEHALRQEFKRLALNDRRMRGLSQSQRQAIEKVAKGGPIENTLRGLGKFDPTTSVVSAAGSLGTSALLSTLNPAAAALPVAGIIGKRMATRMTRNNVASAREALVGRKDVNEALARAVQEAAARQPKPVAPAAMEGELMQRAPLALPSPSIVAGTRSAPGTAYAREQMGLTPDVEQAGALHPGAARETIKPQPAALPNRQAPAALADKRAMVVDAMGRVALNRDQLRDYLRTTGQDGMRNVRQPAIGAITESQRLEAQARQMGLFESKNATPSQQALEQEWRARWLAAKAREAG